MVAKAVLDELRSLGFASISGTYAAVGTPFGKLCRLFCITNNTEGDMLFTTDSSRDELFIAAGSFKLIDVQSNMNPHDDDRYVLPIGTQVYVKQLEAPVSGSVYLEVMY